jgi:hypothetical protein
MLFDQGLKAVMPLHYFSMETGLIFYDPV